MQAHHRRAIPPNRDSVGFPMAGQVRSLCDGSAAPAPLSAADTVLRTRARRVCNRLGAHQLGLLFEDEAVELMALESPVGECRVALPRNKVGDRTHLGETGKAGLDGT